MKRSRRTRSAVLIVGRVAWVQLTKGYVAVIDARDVELVAPYAWLAKCDRGAVYASSGRAGKLHAFLSGHGCDHRNGFTLDNRRENLRKANHVQQSQNRRRRSDNSSGFKGVVVTPNPKPYRVRIHIGGKRVLIGDFRNAEEAARAYDRAARQHYGDFARLNFPKRGEVGA